MKRTGLLAWCAALLAIAMLTSCSDPKASLSESAASDPELHTFTTVGAITPSMEFKNGETLENNVHLRWARDRLGIRIRYLWTVPSTLFDMKLKLELAAGRQVPDVVTTRSETIHELIDSGHFREVGSLFDRYASESWKKAMNEYPDLWEPFTRDGERYAIPILDYAYSSDPVLWIRTDWLEKLGLEAPRTVKELENVMRAFAYRDPDGNGKNDTLGLALALKSGFSTWMGDTSWLFGAYGTVPEQWNETAEGRLAYGSVQPGAGLALRDLQSWMKEGLIDGEAELMDEIAAANSFTSGEAGMIAGAHWMIYWPLNTMTQGTSKAAFRSFPIPAGPEGHVGRRGSLVRNGGILISEGMADPEQFFRYQNYLFETYARNEGEFKYGLAENYDWSNIDGQPSTDPKRIPGGAVRVASYTLTFDGARIPSMWRQDGQPNTIEVLLSQEQYSKPNLHQGAPTPGQKTHGEVLRKLEFETFRQIVYGQLPVAAFDDYVARWHSLGGDQITTEVNDWWADKQRAGGAE